MKITVNPGANHQLVLDVGVMPVTIENALFGVKFVTPDGDHLMVSTRHGGFEVLHMWTDEDGTKKQSGWIEITKGDNNGR